MRIHITNTKNIIFRIDKNNRKKNIQDIRIHSGQKRE